MDTCDAQWWFHYITYFELCHPWHDDFFSRRGECGLTGVAFAIILNPPLMETKWCYVHSAWSL